MIRLIYEVTGNHYKDTWKKIVMRTFVAVEITDHGLLEEIKKFQSDINIKAKPVNLDIIHFTLLFLGEISEEISNKVQVALRSIRFSSFDVKFIGVGAFPKAKFPRVIWIGTDSSGGEKLANLAKKVEDALLPLGFKSDKAFKPHITVFRVKNKIGDISDDLTKFNTREFGIQKITEIKFKKSTLKPEGPIYSDLQVVLAQP